MCVKGFLVLALGPQGAGAPPAMMRCRMTGFPKNWGSGSPKRQAKVDTICTVPLDCGTPTTRRLYPFGAFHLFMFTFHHLLVIVVCHDQVRRQVCRAS